MANINDKIRGKKLFKQGLATVPGDVCGVGEKVVMEK